jgi:hypothetical protein
MCALPHAGNENFPDARRAEQPHRVKASVPIVKIADDADALGVRRPHGKTGAVNAVNRAQLRAELVINFPLVAFAKQKQIGFAQRRQKRIRIARAASFARFIRDDQVVGVNRINQLADTFKHIRVWNPFQLKLWFVLFVHRLNFHSGRIGQQRANHDS